MEQSKRIEIESKLLEILEDAERAFHGFARTQNTISISKVCEYVANIQENIKKLEKVIEG